ncbi:MAG: peptidylprolyl isomerase [Okeania sp. SIO2C2]|uniref:peptidylprolyl isomerase n=1 Tax=Okeania sp. SIO2C2 TaxID=2607787 RepID=UPI0013B83C37|nr:peptidyl-prolyl cis-trans isomerase [Okeania sp. SIO2C2]NEP85804.1 peptidylprolyl isomerase [Okeania sp. SIO2C2]
MESKPLLTIGEEQLSWGQGLRYLQASGKLQSFVTEIVRQYVIEKELQSREDINVNPAVLQQAIIDFRLQRKLEDQQKFQEWLQQNRINYNALESQIENSFKLKQLKDSVTVEKIETYFNERKAGLDYVILSRIVVGDQELADALRRKIVEEGSRFEDLAKEYSVTNDKNFNGIMGAVSLSSLPEDLRNSVNTANPGEILGPFQTNKFWSLFRLEQLQGASLDNPEIRKKLDGELFERWISEKLQDNKITLHVND